MADECLSPVDGTFTKEMADECPICLSPVDGTFTTMGCCKKQFHTQCLLTCVSQKNECPLCRHECVITLEHPQQQQQIVIVQPPTVGILGGVFVLVVFGALFMHY